MLLRLKVTGIVASFPLFFLLSLLLESEKGLARLWLDGLFIGLGALTIILVPAIWRTPYWLVVFAGLLLFGGFKWLMLEAAPAPDGIAWVVFLLEGLFLALVFRLAHGVSAELYALQTGEGVLGLVVEALPDLDSEVGREIVKREMKRCRREERPFSIILFDTSPLLADDRQDNQPDVPLSLRAAIQKTRIAGFIRSRSAPPAPLLLAAGQTRLLALYPVATQEAAQWAVAMGQAVAAEYGSCPIWAVATFPNHGLTFNKIWHEALTALEAAGQTEPITGALTRRTNYSGG